MNGFNHRVTLELKVAFEVLEPREVKVSCGVLRGLGVSNDPRLPDVRQAWRAAL